MTDTTKPDDRPLVGERRQELLDLAQKLQFMGSDSDRAALEKKASDEAMKWDEATPVSFQVLKSGATAIAVQWTKQAKKYGGGAAAATAGAAVIASVIKAFPAAEVPNSILVTLIGAAAVLLSATAIAIAVIVAADLNGRSAVTVSRAEGRARLSAAYLDALTEADEAEGAAKKPAAASGEAMRETDLLLAAAGNWPVKVATKEQGEQEVTRVFMRDGKLRFNTATDTVSCEEIVSWSSEKPLPAAD
jgi:hypothetical protein